MVSFTRFDGGVAFIWASSGILLARLNHLPPSRWFPPIICCGIAVMVMSATVGLGVAAAPWMALANLSEPVMAALLLRRFVGSSAQMDTVRGVTGFLLVAGMLAPALSGIGGATAVSLFAHVPFAANWLGWFAAHGLGALLVTPVAWAAMSGEMLNWRRNALAARTRSTLVMLVLVGVVASLVFSQTRMPILFLPMLPMVFATMQGGRPGAIASTIILAAVAGIFSAQGSGPVHLMQASNGARSIFLQAYIAYSALLVLPVAAILKQRQTLVRRLAASEALYRTIADSLGDAVLDVAIDGTIRYASPVVATIAGIDAGALIGTNARSLVHDEDVDMVWNAHQSALACPGMAYTAQYRGTAQAADKWFEVSIRAVASPDGIALGVVGSIRDITARKSEEQMLQHEAQTDVLTGLPNRRAFQAMLAASLAQAGDHPGRDSLAIFDLDRFKAVNDTYGHAAGDAVLVAVAKAAQAGLRSGDRICRIGGEEFAVLFHGVDLDDATAAARRLQNAVRALRIPFDDGPALAVTISMGLCQVHAASNIGELMARADHELYVAKRSGRDCLRIAA
jgi:diguanylate cyclase (GGDEF)-like protein/PAS domain S-box-containing protein